MNEMTLLKNIKTGFLRDEINKGELKEGDLLIRCVKCGFPFVLAEEYIKDKKIVKVKCPCCDKHFNYTLPKKEM